MFCLPVVCCSKESDTTERLNWTKLNTFTPHTTHTHMHTLHTPMHTPHTHYTHHTHAHTLHTTCARTHYTSPHTHHAHILHTHAHHTHITYTTHTHTHTHTHTVAIEESLCTVWLAPDHSWYVQGGHLTPARTIVFLPSNPGFGMKRFCLFAAAKMIVRSAQELHVWAHVP